MQDFRNLKIWERAHGLVLEVYKATAAFPKEEIYGLTSQIRRAAASIPCNIAEGCGKASDADLANYIQIAMGSASELDYELQLAHDLNYLPADVYSVLSEELTEIRKMMNAFVQRLRKKD
jgi:four helix bundle protein